MSPLALAGYVWQTGAVLFLALVVYGIHRARKRGERLFRDLPTERVRALRPDTTHAHEMDAI